MKSLTPLPWNRGAAKRLRVPHICSQITLPLIFLITTALPVSAKEITALHDVQGHCIYINSDDQELRNSVKRGGMTAALQVIDQRKHALPGIDQFIEQASLEQRLDPRLVRAIIQVESAWNARARSRKGALGLMQLMPETALRFGVRDPFNARENIRGGTRYLRSLLDRFHSNLKYTLAAYNAGEKAVAAWGDVPPYEETRSYLQRIGMIYAAAQQEADLRASAISRTVQGNRIIYTNLD
jgi:soluble lytic murein transglycosylase-like protein